MIGQRFSRWIVIEEGAITRFPCGAPRRKVRCRCFCGKEKLIHVNDLRRGKSRSCGCLRSEKLRGQGDAQGMKTLVDGFLGWTTEFLNFIPVGDTYALVDEKDFAVLNKMNWYLKRSGTCYYAHTTIRRNKKAPFVAMHQLLLPVPKGQEVDHKNHNGLDNRRTNLRAATRSQNIANRKKFRRANKQSSEYKGVWRKDGKWEAGLRHRYLGTFSTEQEAARAYNDAAIKLYGEFAQVNRI